METYHKINSLFKRNMAGDKKLVIGDWATPEFEYLQNNKWEFTEKVDGTNIRVQIVRPPDNDLRFYFGGRTDRAEIPDGLYGALTKEFYTPGLEANAEVMMERHGIREIMLFGEGYGPKIQRGGKYRDTPGFVLFDVRVGTFWLDRAEVEDVASTLGLETVPVIGNGTLHDAVGIVKQGYTVRDGVIKGFLDSPGYMKSQYGDFEAEGIVARPVVPMFDRQGARVIAKIKGVDFR